MTGLKGQLKVIDMNNVWVTGSLMLFGRKAVKNINNTQIIIWLL